MKLSLRLLVPVAIALAIGFATAAEKNPLATPPKGRPFTPSRVIFPDQDIPLRFFHDKHLAQELECTICHEKAPDSVRSSDMLVPVNFEGEQICATCHDVSSGADASPPAACQTCHFESYQPKFPEGADTKDPHKTTTPPPRIRIPAPNLKMNHKVHIDKGIACTTCHGEMTAIQVATRENALPLMNTCLTCHNGKEAPNACRTCHLSKADGKLLTSFPSGQLKPAGHYRNDAHDDHWLENHRQTAAREAEYCAECHEDKYCLKCHNGTSRPLKIHPNNWIVAHPLAARRNDPTCTSCHRTQTFCLECHKRAGVVVARELPTDEDSQKLAFPKSKLGGFHPAGWVETVENNAKRGPNHHSFQAQRNIRTCAACHTEKTCLTCHKSGELQGSGINPHPSNFRGSQKCKALKRANESMCTKCHLKAPDC